MIVLVLATLLAAPDRSAPPPVQPATPLPLEEPVWTDLSEATRVGVVTVPGVRKVEVLVVVHAGAHELDGEMSPSAQATGWLMDVATREHDAEALEVLRATADAQLWSSIQQHDLQVGGSVPRDRLEDLVGWIGEVLRSPRFPGSEVRRWRDERTVELVYDAPTRASSLATYAVDHTWMPRGHPYRTPPDLRAISGVRPKALRTRHEDILTRGPVTALVVGDVEPDGVLSLLGPVLAGLGRPGPRPRPLPVPGPEESAIVAVDLPTPQATLDLRFAAPPSEHAAHLAFEAVDHALGGTFLSRLNGNLREENGYTYGIYSAYRHDAVSGQWATRTEVAVSDVVAAITEIRHELARMVEGGPEQVELDAFQREALSDWNETLSTADSAMARYSDLLLRDRTLSDARARLDALAALGRDAPHDAAAWLSEDRPHLWTVVGPRDLLEEPLGELGLPVTWVTPDQAISATFDDPTRRPPSRSE